jgi:hypothetical protein
MTMLCNGFPLAPKTLKRRSHPMGRRIPREIACACPRCPICFGTQEHAWGEDARRVDNGSQVRRVTQLALTSRPSVDFSGYHQRHLNVVP